MAAGRFIAYYRVSTERQGRSGLGLEAQQRTVRDFLNGGAWHLVREFTEIESGRRCDRPVLAQAMAACRVHRAKLVIAKLDRLARDAHFLLGLQKAGVDFIACDVPTVHRLTVGMLALVAEEEARAISARTKAALAAAKARGVKLGAPGASVAPADAARGRAASVAARSAAASARAKDLASVVARLRTEGAGTLSAIAAGLEELSVPAPRRGGRWQPTQVARLLARIDGTTPA